MKSIFIDCNNQLAPVFARARNADDPPIAVNTDPFQSADLPRLLAGYDICLDDHSVHADRGHGRMPRAQAHCFSRHRRVELHGRSGAGRPRHHGPHHQGLWRHRGCRAHHGADIRLRPRPRAHGPRSARGRMGAARKHAAQRQDARPDRARRHRPGGGADRARHRNGGDRLEPVAAPRRRRAPGRSRRAAGAGGRDLAASCAQR